MTTDAIPAALIAEMQAKLDQLPAREIPYADLLASFDWQPIISYDIGAAPIVLFRRGDEACAGSWCEAVLFPKWTEEPGAMWRSAEDGSLEMPLQFEPEEFAVLDRETMLGFTAS